MSLINKMLSDLESREVLLADKQDVMLDGLYSAYDVEIENKPDRRKYYYIVLICALLIAAVYAINQSNQIFISSYDHEDNNPASHQLSGSELPAKVSAIENNPEYNSTAIVDESRFSLRLDDLLNSHGVISTGTSNTKDPKLIEKIDLESMDHKIILSMNMPVDPHYSLYTLESPYRTVLQVSEMDYKNALPAIEEHPLITNIRKRRDDNGNFIFVMESANPLTIVNSGYKQNENDYTLQVTLLTVQEQSGSVTANPSVKISEVDKLVVTNEDVMRGDLVKTMHQPRPISATDKMLSEGLSLYERGHVAEGLDKLYATVKSDESHVRARATLAVILVEQSQGQLAISLLEDGLHQYPQESAWSRLLARIHMDAGNLTFAREVLIRSMPDINSDPEYHALYAAILQKLAVHDEAARTYRILVNVQPNNGLWWMGLAISLEAISRNNDAMFAYRNALNGQSLTPETHRYIIERIRYLDSRRSHESS